MKAIRFILLTMVNLLVGATIAQAAGFAAEAGAATGALLPIALGAFMPSGVLAEGVLTEVWTGELIKALRGDEEPTFLNGVPDYSQYAQNDVIHLVDCGADPEVLVNNTTYPLEVQKIDDTDATFVLDKFQTRPTPATDDELYAISYRKMDSLKERHSAAISEKKFAKAAHALAPAKQAKGTPVLKTTGERDAATGRLRLTTQDIVALKKEFDLLKCPVQGRRLVLCPDHVNDLLLSDQKFRDQYYNYQTGRIANLYGFEVYEYADCPCYSSAGQKVAFGQQPTTGGFQASVAFHISRVFKASGSTTMYYSEARTDPQNQRNLVNFRHYFVALPKRQEAIGAIMSAYQAG